MSVQPSSNVNNICVEPRKHISELPAVKAVDELKEAPTWIGLCDKLALQAKAKAIQMRFSNHPYLFTKQNLAKRQVLRANIILQISKLERRIQTLKLKQTLCNKLKTFDDAMEALGDEIDVHYYRVLFSPCFSYTI